MESINNLENNKKEKELEEKKSRKIELAKELVERGEKFPFPGITKESYDKIKSDEDELREMGISVFSTPIDELLEKFKNEGLKVVLGKNPKSGNIFILPFRSDDIENDNLFPRHLDPDSISDEKLKELVLLDN